MRKSTVLAAVLVFALVSSVKAAVSLGVTAGNQGLQSFYLAIGDYNRVPEKEVVVVRQQGIPDEDLPVVFFLAKHANVQYAEILKLRKKRWSWMKIVRKYRLDPAIFYVPVKTEVKGKAYGKPYKYYRSKPQKKWKNINLNDREIVNCVNLRFVSEHYGYDPDEVIRMRESGKNFVTINNEVREVHMKQMKTKKVKIIKGKSGKGKKGR
jgi:hypothetical protein